MFLKHTKTHFKLQKTLFDVKFHTELLNKLLQLWRETISVVWAFL